MQKLPFVFTYGVKFGKVLGGVTSFDAREVLKFISSLFFRLLTFTQAEGRDQGCFRKSLEDRFPLLPLPAYPLRAPILALKGCSFL